MTDRATTDSPNERPEFAPPEWAYHGFPLQDGEELSLTWVSEQGTDRIRRARDTGDRTLIGPVLHWAHRFVSSQGPDGDWPAVVSTRTGEPLSEQRTKEPARMLAMLGDLLGSSEFDRAIARSERA